MTPHHISWQRNDEENLLVLFERVLHPSAMPAERARLVWERFVQLELCLSRTGGSLIKAQNVENRMNQVCMYICMWGGVVQETLVVWVSWLQLLLQ